MLRKIILLLLLSISLLASPAKAAGRILILDGYVDGLPFVWRFKQAIRNKLEARAPGVVVHDYSLDIYRPQDAAYKKMITELLIKTYAGQVDLMVIIDPKGFNFYRKRLRDAFSDIPVLYSNDRGEVPELLDNEYQLLIKPNLLKTLKIARHHYPQLKRLYLLGDRYNQELAQDTLREQLEGIELHKLGELTLAQMRNAIGQLQEGDLLLFQLLFADGAGEPMVPPVRYVREFSDLSPVPTLCMYANFIDYGCLGGSVASPQTQATAVAEAIEKFAWPAVIGQPLSEPADHPPKSAKLLELVATESIVDYAGLKRFQLTTDRLSNVRYLGAPEPLYIGYARELAYAVAAALMLLLVTTIALWLMRRRKNLLHRFFSLTENVPTGIFWLAKQHNRWHHNAQIANWSKEMAMPIEAIRQAAFDHATHPKASQEHLSLGQAGQRRWFRIRTTQNHAHPELLLMEEITSVRKYQKLLETQANVDELTGLYNRRAIQSELRRWCASHQRDGQAFALLLIDLDGFKAINDQHGHIVGDQVLRIIGGRLQKRCRDSDIIGRLGGDEFVMLARGLHHTLEAKSLSDAVLQAVSEPIVVETDHPLRCSLSASIGIALCPEHSCDPDSLLIFADRAMYTIKRGNKSGALIYNPEAENPITD